MAIIKQREKYLKDEIIKITSIPLRAFTNLKSFSKNLSIEKLDEIIEDEHLMKDVYQNAIQLAITNLSLGPLGKDLRRNIAYLGISKYLQNITHNAFAIANFFKSNLEQIEPHLDEQFNFSWIGEFSSKIIKKLSLIINLLEKEEDELSISTIMESTSIKKVYRLLIVDKIDELKECVKSFDNKKHELLKIWIHVFLIASKNFEMALDNIKEISEKIHFINIGRL